MKCYIFCGYCNGKVENISKEILSGDLVVCADKGYEIAKEHGVRIDTVIGDFDSFSGDITEKDTKIIKLKAQKDETDTLECVNYGLNKGYRKFVIIGGIGGRFDHTYANVQTLKYILDKSAFAVMTDEYTKIMLCPEGEYELENEDGKYFSVFSYTEECEGLSIEGAKYLLNGAKITNSFPVGVSNEFIGRKVKITLEKGIALIIVTTK